MSDPGLVIVDNSMIARFLDPYRTDQLSRSLRAAHLAIWPTAINVVEASKASPSIQHRLLAWLRRFHVRNTVLPHPYVFLAQLGEAQLGGKAQMHLHPTFCDAVLRNGIASEEFSEWAREESARDELRFLAMLESTKAEIRPDLTRFPIAQRKELTLAMWLDEVWSDPEGRETCVRGLWDIVQVDAPYDESVRTSHDAWNIFADALGATLFVRTVKHETPKNPLGMYDLLQIVYASVDLRARIFVTDDRSLAEVAKEVLNWRFANARAMHSTEFAEACGISLEER